MECILKVYWAITQLYSWTLTNIKFEFDVASQNIALEFIPFSRLASQLCSYTIMFELYIFDLFPYCFDL